MPSIAAPTRTPICLPAGMPVPRFRYSVESADEQVRTFEYSIDGAGEVLEVDDSGWEDERDVLHTIAATLETVWPGRGFNDMLQLTGEQHRDIEDAGLFEELLRDIALGLPARVVLAQVTAAARAA